MQHRIICSSCEQTLKEGIEPPEFKLCRECVIKTTPAADLTALIGPDGKRIPKKKAPVPNMVEVFTEMYTQEIPGRPRPAILLAFKVTDKKHNPLLDFAVDLEKVTGWYHQMRKIDDEFDKKDKD